MPLLGPVNTAEPLNVPAPVAPSKRPVPPVIVYVPANVTVFPIIDVNRPVNCEATVSPLAAVYTEVAVSAPVQRLAT